MMAKEERSLGDLFSELANETGTLVRQEVALAQVELTHKASRAGKQVGFLAVGGAVGYAAMLAVMAGVIILLGNIMPPWLAAIVVGLAVGAAAYFLINSALENLKRSSLAPTETVDSLKEDAQWLKKQVS
jgi:hypothetical protein